MPTPTQYFVDIAVRYGDIDPDDMEAVQQWFIEVLPTLQRNTINDIFDELLENDGSFRDHETKPAYPKDVPLPSLSTSPPVPVPMLAAHISGFLTKLIRRKEGG